MTAAGVTGESSLVSRHPDAVISSGPTIGWRLLYSIVAGGLLAASFPPYRLSIVLPFGFALLVYALDGLRPRHGFYLGFAAGVVYFGATLFWLANLFGTASISLIAIAASFLALFCVTFATLRLRLPRIPVWILAPFLWTGIEYFRSEPFPLNFGWMGFGYGVVNSPVASRLASWIGCYGVTFAICVIGSVIYRAATTANYRLAAAAIGIWIAVVYAPLAGPRIENPLRVRLVQARSGEDDDLFKFSQVTPAFRPNAIVWPEYSLQTDPTRDPKLWSKLKEVAKANGAYLIFGAKETIGVKESEVYHNTAFVLGPDGAIAGKHYKNHPVHFIKDGLAGRDSSAIPTPLGKLGVAICFDMDYPDVAKRLAQDGAEVFLVPNMDPDEWGPVQREQHRLMFQMRAAECGKWLARADVAGGTSVSDPNGQEVARIRSGEPGRLDYTIGKNRDRTPFVLGGWMFGPACLVLACMLVLVAALRPSSARAEGTEPNMP
jgi:apolipoprotein N-acyltransferase